MRSSDDLLEVVKDGLVIIVGQHIEDLVSCLGLEIAMVLEPLAADSAGKVQVLLHHGNSVCVDGTKVGVLEETGKVALSSLLEGDEGSRLESELGVDTVADGADESLEGGLGEHEGCLLLISLDLSQSDGSGSKPALLLDTTLSGGGLLLGLGSLADLRASVY